MKSRMLEEMVGVYRKSAGSRAHRKCVLFNLEEVEAKMEEVCNFFSFHKTVRRFISEAANFRRLKKTVF
jgi:hypothetical protein